MGGMLDFEKPLTVVQTLRATPREYTCSIDGAAVGQHIRISNYLPCDIQVALRNGLVYTVQPKVPPHGSSAGVVIHLSIDVDRNYVKIDSKSQLNDPINEDQKLLKASLKSAKRGNVSIDEKIVEYFISRDTIDTEGGLVYLPEVDVQLSTYSATTTPEHPFSFSGYETHAIVDNDFLGSQQLTGLAFKFVDNAGKYGVRFINLNRSVYQLTPVTDLNLNDGLYVTTNGLCSGSRRRPTTKTQFYDLAKIDDSFGKLYKTAEEARIDGDPDIISKREHERNESELRTETLRLKSLQLENERELATLKRQADLSKIEIARIQSDADRVKLESEQREQQFKAMERDFEHRRKMMETELQFRKMDRSDFYDERASARKDSSDIVKMLPIIITGVVSLIALINSTKK